MKHLCKICSGSTHQLVDPLLKVVYDVCDTCDFIYKQAAYHVSKEREHHEYNQHNNTFESTGYVNIFKHLINDFILPLKITGKGLDYGSGPGPVLKTLLMREGYEMFDYDPFYNDNVDYLNHTYDFITSTEVIEHFSDPLKEVKHLVSLLKKGGRLILMTQFRSMDEHAFLNWYYRRDVTHISFYRLKTFQYLETVFDLEIVKTNYKNIIVYKAN
jgi:SAM-dependent methyltransferase